MAGNVEMLVGEADGVAVVVIVVIGGGGIGVIGSSLLATTMRYSDARHWRTCCWS